MVRCLLRCLCSERSKHEDSDGDGDSTALSGNGAEKLVELSDVELSDGLSPKARGKQSIAAASRLSGRSSSGEGGLADTPIPVKIVTVKLRRAAADLPLGLTINGSRNLVTEVLPGSPAEAGGVRMFDVVLKIDGAALGDERLSAVLRGPRGPPVLRSDSSHREGVCRHLLPPLLPPCPPPCPPPLPHRQACAQADARAARAEQLRAHRRGRDAAGG